MPQDRPKYFRMSDVQDARKRNLEHAREMNRLQVERATAARDTVSASPKKKKPMSLKAAEKKYVEGY